MFLLLLNGLYIWSGYVSPCVCDAVQRPGHEDQDAQHYCRVDAHEDEQEDPSVLRFLFTVLTVALTCFHELLVDMKANCHQQCKAYNQHPKDFQLLREYEDCREGDDTCDSGHELIDTDEHVGFRGTHGFLLLDSLVLVLVEGIGSDWDLAS